MNTLLKSTMWMPAAGVATASVLFASSASAKGFKSADEAKRFLSGGKWVHKVVGGEESAVIFQASGSLGAGKSIKLGAKEVSKWSVAEFPKRSGKYVLRLHSGGNSGWFTFNWNEGKKAWTSRAWPKHSIAKK